MMHMPRVLRTLFTLGAVLLTAQATGLTASAQEANDAASSPVSAKATALAWLDQFRPRQALFNDQDIARLRDKVSAGTEEEAKAWLDKTASARAALDDPKWRETESWLKEFLSVQAIYSDEQIAHLQSESKTAVKVSQEQLSEILGKIEAARARLARKSKNSEQARTQRLETRKAYEQAAVQQRDAEQRRREQEAQARRASGPPQPVQKPQAKVSRPPLIDSLDYARAAVMGQFWGSY